jgi:hypothetical protein
MPAHRNRIEYQGLERFIKDPKVFKKRKCGTCHKPLSETNPNKNCYACIESGAVIPAWEITMKKAANWKKWYLRRKRRAKKSRTATISGRVGIRGRAKHTKKRKGRD